MFHMGKPHWESWCQTCPLPCCRITPTCYTCRFGGKHPTPVTCDILILIRRRPLVCFKPGRIDIERREIWRGLKSESIEGRRLGELWIYN